MSTFDDTRCGSLTRDQVVALRRDGVHPDDIAAQAGVAASTLYRALQAWGLTSKRGGDRRSRDWRARLAAQLGGAA